MSEKVLESAVLDDLIEHIGAEAARAVIELFIGECGELTATIAAPDADPEAVRRAAHSLKSSAGQLGAAALSDAAIAVESAASAGSPDLQQLIAGLCACAAATQRALAARLAA
ncbi:MAG TPA: Hpt domain-containing protein [Stellaceae bacterium]|nr:Hpt domain-containing protein [Stellaceae bacterium]